MAVYAEQFGAFLQYRWVCRKLLLSVIGLNLTTAIFSLGGEIQN
jgi:hypothetical protein